MTETVRGSVMSHLEIALSFMGEENGEQNITRESALAKTKLEECLMWLKRDKDVRIRERMKIVDD